MKRVLVIDSGVGGLNVLRELQKRCGCQNYLYFADSEYFPYGVKSKAEVQARVHKILSAFSDVVGMCVLACNTASSVFDEKCRAEYAFPIVDVIEPTVKDAAALTNTKHVVVLSTELTASCGVYERLFALNGIQARSVACPKLVTLAENRQPLKACEGVLFDVVKEVLQDDQSDVVVLGCTHFDWFIDKLRNEVGDSRHVVSSALSAAKQCQVLLQSVCPTTSNGGGTIYLTSSKKHTVYKFSQHDVPFKLFSI